MLQGPDLASICIPPSLGIGEAVRIMDQTHRRILLIVDEAGYLLGVVADPDFRRAMLAGVDFAAPVERIMVSSPIVAYQGMTSQEMLTLLENYHVQSLPVLDPMRRVVGLVQTHELLALHNRRPRHAAVVMAGGEGQRLRPLTETTPKPLIEIGGQPILFTILDKLLAAQFHPIYVSINYLGDKIRSRINAVPRYRTAVRFISEDKPMGTAGALGLLPQRPSRPFLMINGDVLTTLNLEEMVATHSREQNLMTLGLREESHQLAYGIVRLTGTRVTDILEKPMMTHFINTGIYVLDPTVVDLIPADACFDATDLINRIVATGGRVGGFLVREYWIDVGRHPDLAKAEQEFSNHFPAARPARKSSKNAVALS
jgi:dTDP-glucose pyrophosphorylase